MKLAFQQLSPTYKHSINHGVHEGSVERQKKQFLAGNLDFDVWLPTRGMNLQRGLVWTLLQKQQFILSVLREHELPTFAKVRHMFADQTEINQVLDGKQRLNTMFQFIDGEFSIEFGGESYVFDDLDQRLRNCILNPRGFKWDVHYSYWDDPISDETKIEIFERINFLGTPQEIEHLNRLKL